MVLLPAIHLYHFVQHILKQPDFNFHIWLFDPFFHDISINENGSLFSSKFMLSLTVRWLNLVLGTILLPCSFSYSTIVIISCLACENSQNFLFLEMCKYT